MGIERLGNWELTTEGTEKNRSLAALAMTMVARYGFSSRTKAPPAFMLLFTGLKAGAPTGNAGFFAELGAKRITYRGHEGISGLGPSAPLRGVRDGNPWEIGPGMDSSASPLKGSYRCARDEKVGSASSC
jgi:hypothetical protein